MRVFGFGAVRAVDGRTGPGTVGTFGLHVQCAWRLEAADGIITGDTDLYTYAGSAPEPSNWTYEDGRSLQTAELTKSSALASVASGPTIMHQA